MRMFWSYTAIMLSTAHQTYFKVTGWSSSLYTKHSIKYKKSTVDTRFEAGNPLIASF